MEFVGSKDVSVRKISNPKAARSLIIYTKSCGQELAACLITKKAIPKEYVREEVILEKEKFEIGLIDMLPVVKGLPWEKELGCGGRF